MSIKNAHTKGYTLIEIMVAVGLFAIIMLLASGAYLVVIGLNKQSQSVTTGINNLSFALDLMTNSMRTGTHYTCPTGGTTCTIDASVSEFVFTDADGATRIHYSLDGSAHQIQEQVGDSASAVYLTDPSVKVTSLVFYVDGAKPYSDSSDTTQSHVIMTVSGTAGTQSFTIETEASMRGTDL